MDGADANWPFGGGGSRADGERELGGHAQAFAFEERARELVARQHVVLALVDDGRFADVEVGRGHRSAAVGLEHAHPV